MNSTNFFDILLTASTVIGSLGMLLMVAGGIAATILDNDATDEPHSSPRVDAAASHAPTTAQQPCRPLAAYGVLHQP